MNGPAWEQGLSVKGFTLHEYGLGLMPTSLLLVIISFLITFLRLLLRTLRLL